MVLTKYKESHYLGFWLLFALFVCFVFVLFCCYFFVGFCLFFVFSVLFFFGSGWLSIYLTNSIQGMTWKTQSPGKLSTEPLNWSWRMDQGNVSVKVRGLKNSQDIEQFYLQPKVGVTAELLSNSLLY